MREVDKTKAGAVKLSDKIMKDFKDFDKADNVSISLNEEDSSAFYIHTEHPLEDKKKDESTEKTDDKNCIRQPIHVIFFITLFIILIVMPVITCVFVLRSANHNDSDSLSDRWAACTNVCSLAVVESIPENLTYPAGSPSHMSTYQGLLTLLNAARVSIDIASFYWTLQSNDIKPSDPSSWQGQNIFDTLYKAGKYRGIKIRIAQNKPSARLPNRDTEILASEAGAEVRSLDFDKLMGAGILHTKMWLIDRQHYYVGSANLDWRSLTQVKELGAIVQNCSCMAEDMAKIFDVYWVLGDSSTVPAHWPASYATDINSSHPAEITFNGFPASTYLSSSPATFCPTGRTVDVDAILTVIREAEEFVYIAVMDYLPVIVSYGPSPNKFWPVIDDELRRAAYERRVDVRLLGSLWNQTDPSMLKFLKSLAAVSYTGQGSIEVKLFRVPFYTPAQKRIPFARVNHNKYMVTERSAYIGTSNWSGDYFVSTGGIGFIVTQPKPGAHNSNELPTRQQVEDIFLRDWNSQYAKHINTSEKAVYDIEVK